MKHFLAAMAVCFCICALIGCSDGANDERSKLRQLAPELCAGSRTERTEASLLSEPDLSLSVTELRGSEPGKTVYIVAGLHGDEQAGWEAGSLLKQMDVAAGTVWIISPANEYGAEHHQRTTRSRRDPNRWFGSDTLWDSALIDNAIAKDIEEKRPDLILDLHEAHGSALAGNEGGADALGNSIVCYSLENIGEMVLDFLAETQDTSAFSGRFTLYASPPEGSLNDYAGRKLCLPVITVETSRDEELSARIQNQLNTVRWFLSYLSLL